MKIVYLVSRVPFPLEKGDKLRAYHQLKQLSKKFEVHLICLNDTSINAIAIKELESFCSSVTIHKLSKIKIFFRLFFALFSKKPFQVNYFYDAFVAKKIVKQISTINPSHIFCQLIRTSEYVKNLHQFTKTIDYMDAFSKGMLRRAETEKFPIKLFVKAEANRLTTYENLIFDYFDFKIIISEQDRDLIYHKDRKEIIVVPNGVDEDLINSNVVAEKKFDVLFHGNLSYIPNVDCVKYIVTEVMPVLVKFRPQIKVAISGATPSKKVVELCRQFPTNIVLLGFVDDIIVTYKSARTFFAPLQIGTGLQNKILEAMALKVPCVTSELCNNALKAKNEVQIITGKKPISYVNGIIKLLDDPQFSNSIAHEGFEFVKNNYSWEKSTIPLLNLISK